MTRAVWPKRPVYWQNEKYHYWSFVFTWDLYAWMMTAQPEIDGKQIVVGGPAVRLMPNVIPDWITIGNGEVDVLFRHNPQATRTSIGCIRKCAFCVVPRTEGPLQELCEWPLRPVLIDNNLLACSVSHFDHVIDRLKRLDWCDFNQGLDARLLTKHHAERLAELKQPTIRLSFDNSRDEGALLGAYEKLCKQGIPKRLMTVYVLIGFDDTPEDAQYRLSLVRSLGIFPFPMRYQPPMAKVKNEYVGKSWTHKELDRFMSYWSNLRYTSKVPFGEYVHGGSR
jgi:hypothetical protein